MLFLRDHEVILYHYVHSFSQDGIMEDHFMLMRALTPPSTSACPLVSNVSALCMITPCFNTTTTMAKLYSGDAMETCTDFKMLVQFIGVLLVIGSSASTTLMASP